MDRLKRLFYILLLNILVSATTTLAVLVYWERREQPTAINSPQVVFIQSTQVISATVIALVTPQMELVLATQPSVDEPTEEGFPVPVMEYRVRTGDTLSSIALEFDANILDIMEINQINDPDNIRVGQVLYIPSRPLPTETSPLPTTALPTLTPTLSKTVAPTQTPTPQEGTPRAFIDSVIGAGQLANERVIIMRLGPDELSLAGWRIEDEDGYVYIFPQLELLEAGSVTVHTTVGLDTVTDLYWGLDQPVWEPGEWVTLRDNLGNAHAVYQVP